MIIHKVLLLIKEKYIKVTTGKTLKTISFLTDNAGLKKANLLPHTGSIPRITNSGQSTSRT